MRYISKLTIAVLAAVALTFGANVQAQSITLSGVDPTYSQNFDSMGTSAGSFPPTPGWFVGAVLSAGITGTNGTFAPVGAAAGTGGGNTGTNYNFGIAGAGPVTDRALGSVASGTKGTEVTEARFFNDSSLTITGMSISYTGEQWRNGGNTSTSPLSLHASLDGSTFTALGSSFYFISPIVGATAGALDGNLAANRTTGIGGSVDLAALLGGGGLANGATLYLRWVDVNDAGNDHALAIDDLTVNFSSIPEPSTVLLVGVGLVGMLALRRRRS